MKSNYSLPVASFLLVCFWIMGQNQSLADSGRPISAADFTIQDASVLNPNSSFDYSHVFSSGAPGAPGRTNIGVSGETHQYSGALEENTTEAGGGGLPIYDYPDHSLTGGRMGGGNGTASESPVGRGGVPPTHFGDVTLHSKFGDTNFGTTSFPSGLNSFGFSGSGAPSAYAAKRGIGMPPTSTSSVDIQITDDHGRN